MDPKKSVLVVYPTDIKYTLKDLKKKHLFEEEKVVLISEPQSWPEEGTYGFLSRGMRLGC